MKARGLTLCQGSRTLERAPNGAALRHARHQSCRLQRRRARDVANISWVPTDARDVARAPSLKSARLMSRMPERGAIRGSFQGSRTLTESQSSRFQRVVLVFCFLPSSAVFLPSSAFYLHRDLLSRFETKPLTGNIKPQFLS